MEEIISKSSTYIHTQQTHTNTHTHTTHTHTHKHTHTHTRAHARTHQQQQQQQQQQTAVPCRQSTNKAFIRIRAGDSLASSSAACISISPGTPCHSVIVARSPVLAVVATPKPHSQSPPSSSGQAVPPPSVPSSSHPTAPTTNRSRPLDRARESTPLFSVHCRESE